MTENECCAVLLDFIFDRGIFGSAAELEGMAVSQKPDVFVEYYSRLSGADRLMVNACLISSLVGKIPQTERFAGILVMVVLALVDRIPETGLESFQSELLEELNNPKVRDSWLEGCEGESDFRRNWRYALGMINILNKLHVSEVRTVAAGLAASTRSSWFREKLNEILSRSTPTAC